MGVDSNIYIHTYGNICVCVFIIASIYKAKNRIESKWLSLKG